MPLSNSPATYGSVARSLHWLTALLILSNIPLAYLAENLPRSSDADVARVAMVYSLHKTIGLAALIAALLRILWAVTQPNPAPLHPDRRVETFLAAAVHWSLYAAILIMPVTGWLYHAASAGFAPIWWPFGQTLPFVPKSDTLAAQFRALHGWSSKLLILSLIAHIAGALKHALIDRDGTLARMISGRAPAAAIPALPPSSLRPASLALFAWAILIAATLAFAAVKRTETTTSAPTTGNWTVTTGSLTFTARIMGTDVTGTLPDFSASINYDDTSRTGAVDVTLPLSGLTMGAITPQAIGPEFFDLAHHPTARFKASIAEQGGQLVASGTLTLRGKTVPVDLPFTLAFTGDQAKMAGTVTLDRRDFGMGPSYLDETTVAFAVAVAVTLSATRQ